MRGGIRELVTVLLCISTKAYITLITLIDAEKEIFALKLSNKDLVLFAKIISHAQSDPIFNHPQTHFNSKPL